MLNDIVNIIKMVIKIPLYIPHLLVYNLWGKDDEIDITSNFVTYSSLNNKCMRLLYLLATDPYFHEYYFYTIRKLKIRKLLYQNKCTFIIPRDVIIGAGLKLDHPFATILNAEKIGKNFRCKNNITIGNKNDDDNQRPIIGDNVYVGANSVIIGKIQIGDNVVIGAGSVVVKDIPNNCVIVGNPAKILRKI